MIVTPLLPVFDGDKVWKMWSFVYTPHINLKIVVLEFCLGHRNPEICHLH